MTARMIRLIGLASTALYASVIVWLYAQQPRNLAEVTGGIASSVGAYHIDQTSFEEGLRFFRRDQFPEARAAFARADPAQRDSTTQFYVAYSYYRQGWGRLYNDDKLFRRGLDTLSRAVDVSAGARVIVEDPDLGAHSSDELKVELEQGLTRDASDLNPLKVFRARK